MEVTGLCKDIPTTRGLPPIPGRARFNRLSIALITVITEERRLEKRPYKLFDGGGLHILIKPDGNKWWRMKYRFRGKEQLISLGPYPLIDLKEARDRAIRCRVALLKGVNPSGRLFRNGIDVEVENT